MMNMKTNKFKLLLAASAVSIALTGCGDDGKDGVDGKPGEVSVNINSLSAVQTQVEQANYDEASQTLTVEFSLLNANGVAVSGLEEYNSAVRLSFGRTGTRSEVFTAYTTGEGEEQVEVSTRADGDEQIWLSYRNRDKGNGLVAGTSYWSCPTDETCLTYLGQGKYQVTASGIIDTLGLDYGYDATQTQGIALITYNAGDNKLNNFESYYWEPATENAVSSPKQAMMTGTCTNCHVDESIKHGGRFGKTADECSFCHTDYARASGTGTDAEGNTVEFTYDASLKGLVHGFHTGLMLEERRGLAKFSSVIANSNNPAFTYKFDGAVLDAEGNTSKDLNFPASTANCQLCHIDYNATEENLPAKALAWVADTDVTSCQSCHGNYHYGDRTATTEATEGSAATTALVGCVSCHNSHEEGARGGAFRHFAGTGKESREAASQAGMLVETAYSNINWDEATSTLTFTMNLSKGDVAVTSEYVPSVSVYVNAVDSANPDAYLASRTSGSATANTDGSYTVTVNATSASYTLPALADALNNGADLAIMASFKVCVGNKSSDLVALIDNDGDGAVDCDGVDSRGRAASVLSANAATTQFIKLDGTAGVERASAAAYDNCTACHSNDMSTRKDDVHYRNADLHTCAMCHEAGDYNSLIVRVHGTYGKAHGREDVQALISSAECSACHGDNGYSLNNARSTPMRWNRKDATFSSPEAGVCASCHVSDSYEIGGGQASALSHIQGMGGIVAGTYEEAELATETCSTCHNADSIKKSHAAK